MNYVREHILQFRRGLQKNPCPCLPLIFAAAENKYNYIIMGDKSSFLSNRKRKNVEWMETLVKVLLLSVHLLYANVASRMPSLHNITVWEENTIYLTKKKAIFLNLHNEPNLVWLKLK